MENKFLINLSIKFGLSSDQLSKIVDVAYQVGATDMNSREFKRICNYVCKMKLVEAPAEELIEELKRKGLALI